MKIKKKHTLNQEFSFAGMTDIIFLLLLFFLISSTLVSTQAIKVELPSTESQHTIEKNVNITITPDGNFFFNDEKVEDYDAIKALIVLEKETFGTFTIKLNADKNVSLEKVVDILDIAYKNNLKIFLATKARR